MIFNISLTEISIEKQVYLPFTFFLMKQTTIAVFLSIMFTTLTLAPNIIVLMDHDYDVSVLLETNEEEERKGEEKVKDFEIEIPIHLLLDYANNNIKKVETSNLHIDNYSSIYKELTSPPPKLNI